MPLSSDTKKVFGMCLAVHFGFTEEVKEDENGREEGEEGEDDYAGMPPVKPCTPADRTHPVAPLLRNVDESIAPSPLQHSSEVDESADPTPYQSESSTPEHWYYDPNTYDQFERWLLVCMDESRYARPKRGFFDLGDYLGCKEEFFADRIERAVAVAVAERSVCRLRFLLWQKG